MAKLEVQPWHGKSERDRMVKEFIALCEAQGIIVLRFGPDDKQHGVPRKGEGDGEGDNGSNGRASLSQHP